MDVRLANPGSLLQAGSDHVLREYSSKESKVSELRVRVQPHSQTLSVQC